MRKFLFNTGVNIASGNTYNIDKREVSLNGIIQIPFYCANVPVNTSLMFLCDNSKLPESKLPGVIVREVYKTEMCSKFAYFKTN